MDTTLTPPLVFVNSDNVISGWSDGAQRLLGWSGDEVVGRPLSTIFDERGFFIGSTGPQDLDAEAVPSPDGGSVLALRGNGRQLLEEQLELTFANADVIGAWDWDIAADRVVADARFAKVFGIDPDSARQGLPLADFAAGVHPDDRARVTAEIKDAIDAGSAFNSEYRILRSDGSLSHVLARGRLVQGKGHRPTRFPGVLFDITARRLAESDAVTNRLRYRSLFETLPDGFCVIKMIWDADGAPVDYEFLEVNSAFVRHTGIADAVGKRMRRDVAAGHEQHWFDIYGRVARTGEPISFENPAEALQDRWYQVQAFPIDEARSDHVAVLFSDISDRRRTEVALKASEAEFRTLSQSMLNHVWTAKPDGELDWFNDRVLAFSGRSAQELAGSGWASIVHPDDLETVAASWSAALAAKKVYQTEFRIRRADGRYRWHLVRAVPVRGDGGEMRRWVGTNTDIDHAKKNEAALADLNATLEERIAERSEELLQSQKALQQSQKMETIGKLTGGVAHDFNNLLQVVAGNLQLLSRDVAGNERAASRVDNALAGVARGAKLASQLLAFGRRQALEPKVINVGRFVKGMDDLLRRSIGEGVDIEVIVAGGLWNTLADPTQVENALLNLAINARDAMDGAGKLTIEVGNAFLDDHYATMHADVSAGQYVILAVSDTGSGMSDDILEQVFEPFFSTKPEGKGTGLGLSMVYGFAKQSNGHVKIYSEEGHGTTVKLYLPREIAEEARETAVHVAGPAVGGTETILVVEDDDEVRTTVVETLADLGYRVLTARDAQSGLAVVESGAAIDVLFTDVVMPGTLKSPDMAKLAKARLPDLVVLFTSGYTENSIVHGGKLDHGVELLSKPYTREALDRRIRHLLANRRQVAQRGQGGQGGAVAAAAERMPLTLLLVEDDFLIRMNTADILREHGHEVIEAGTAAQAISAAQAGRIDLILTDLGLPDMQGGDLAVAVRAIRPEVGVVFATGETSMPPGACPGAVLLVKPYTERSLQQAIEKASVQKPGHRPS
ncbi:PAS domain-containing protein [Ensifer sp.]|uniref:PAS domain-containing protein n=1 Tax=Ensifer sp. TaxID=1872086 RepID=UPI0028A07A52|nr:PAS domain-containing protein [Ensifer sp.]